MLQGNTDRHWKVWGVARWQSMYPACVRPWVPSPATQNKNKTKNQKQTDGNKAWSWDGHGVWGRDGRLRPRLHVQPPLSLPAAQQPGALGLPLTNMQLRAWSDGGMAMHGPSSLGHVKGASLGQHNFRSQVSGFIKCARHKAVTCFNCPKSCLMYTRNKLYNILKIAPLESCRGHFISASWICQPQLILRTAHVRMSPNLAVRNMHACLTDWSQKSFLSVELTRAKPSSTIVAYEVKIGKTPNQKQCNPDILAIDYSCLSQTDMKG